MRSLLAVVARILLVVVAGCAPRGDTQAEAARQRARPPVPVETAPVSATDLTERIEVVGTLKPKHEAEVRSEFSGVVTEVYVTEWVPVKKGQALARLDSRESSAAVEAAQAAFLNAQVAEARANREYSRALKLKESGLITQQALEDALTAAEAAQAATSSARAQLNAAQTRLEKTLLRAPIDGIVSYRGVHVGDYVEHMGAPRPMFRIVDNRLMELTVSVPTPKLGLLQVGQSLHFSVDAFPGHQFTGSIKYINPAVEEGTRSVNVVAEVTNESEMLRGGLFVKGHIITATRPNVLVIPRSALLKVDVQAGMADVFVVEEDRPIRRTVHIGSTTDDMVEITSGLSQGENVITRGAFSVRDDDTLLVTSSGT